MIQWNNDDFTVENGTYNYSDIKSVSVLNEKEKYHGKGIPFTAIASSGPLPDGILSNPYLYVGVRIVLKNGTVLGVYTSKTKTMLNTDQYKRDREKAFEIEKEIKKHMSL